MTSSSPFRESAPSSSGLLAADEPTDFISAGLSSETATERLRTFGANEPVSDRSRHALLQFLTVLAQPLPLILLIAAIVSSFVGQAIDAGIIVAMVLVSAAVDFYQTYRSRVAMEKLRNLVAPTATTLRDGVWIEIDRRTIVPDDIIRLSAGDLVPADAVLLTARDLYVQEAMLTGESLPSEKEAKATVADRRRNQVYLGTSVTSGIATARVLATGSGTEFGDIVTKLTSSQEETEFDRGLKHFAYLITQVVFFLVLFVLVASLAMHRNTFESLLFAVALAVGLTPELLPVLTSVTLAKGAARLAEKKVIVKHLSAIQNLGSIDILCSDKTGTLTSGIMSFDRSLNRNGEIDRTVLELAALNSCFETGIRSPLDSAILAAEPGGQKGHIKCDEVPFDFERRRLSVVVEKDGLRRIITKGSPESILLLCDLCRERGQSVALSSAMRIQAQRVYEDLSSNGYRVLAVASKPAVVKGSYSSADECAMELVGFLTFVDPPLPGTADAIRELRQDGVLVKIITGDSPFVAKYLCHEVGIEAGEILLGDDLERMTDTALSVRADQANVFARVSPAQKTRILRALRMRGHVVGFIGDGINDAPSLRAADIGIAAPKAVDVARAAADIILLEPGYRILHEGVREGRTAFGNVMKYLMMGTSSNFGNVLSMALAAVVLPFLPMLPTQILLNNFLYDLSQVTIPTDNVDPEYLDAPRRWDMRLVRRFMLLAGPVSSIFDLLTFYVLLHFLHAGQEEFHTGWFVESLATQTLVLLVIRTMRNPWRSKPSKPLVASVLICVSIGIALPLTPIASLLGFTPLPWSYFGFLVVATTTYLLLIEYVKRWLVRPVLLGSV